VNPAYNIANLAWAKETKPIFSKSNGLKTAVNCSLVFGNCSFVFCACYIVFGACYVSTFCVSIFGVLTDTLGLDSSIETLSAVMIPSKSPLSLLFKSSDFLSSLLALEIGLP
jgi:hypothetical protein